MMDMVAPGKRRRGQPRWRWIDSTREDMNNIYDLTADITDNKQYWKTMVKTWAQRFWIRSLKVRNVRKINKE